MRPDGGARQGFIDFVLNGLRPKTLLEEVADSVRREKWDSVQRSGWGLRQATLAALSTPSVFAPLPRRRMSAIPRGAISGVLDDKQLAGLGRQEAMETARVTWRGWFRPRDVMDGVIEAARYDGVYMWLDTSINPSLDPNTGVHKQILYIGMCHQQSFAERISQEWNEPIGHWLRQNRKYTLTLKLGTVGFVGRERLTKAMVEDLENLLIATQQPPGNVSYTQTYTGRDLEIINAGKASPLPQHLSSVDWAWTVLAKGMFRR